MVISRGSAAISTFVGTKLDNNEIQKTRSNR